MKQTPGNVATAATCSMPPHSAQPPRCIAVPSAAHLSPHAANKGLSLASALALPGAPRRLIRTWPNNYAWAWPPQSCPWGERARLDTRGLPAAPCRCRGARARRSRCRRCSSRGCSGARRCAALPPPPAGCCAGAASLQAHAPARAQARPRVCCCAADQSGVLVVRTLCVSCAKPHAALVLRSFCQPQLNECVSNLDGKACGRNRRPDNHACVRLSSLPETRAAHPGLLLCWAAGAHSCCLQEQGQHTQLVGAFWTRKPVEVLEGADRSPTVIRPTSRVPAMDAFTTGICSDNSDSNTLQRSSTELSFPYLQSLICRDHDTRNALMHAVIRTKLRAIQHACRSSRCRPGPRVHRLK